VGTRRVQAISDLAICAAYRAGESRFAICLRARIYDRELAEILKRNGVTARSDAEWRALSEASRAAYRARRKQLGRACPVRGLAC
jgi:hypothetical protein